MINRRAFLKLTAAASAALLSLKPKAKPQSLALDQEEPDDAFIEFEYGGYLVPPEIALLMIPLYDAP